MKAQEFILTMRKLIREEVRLAIRDELSLIKDKQKQVQEVKKPIAQQTKQPKYNTGNPFLDEVLAETVVSRGFGGEESPVVMEGFDYTTDDVPSMGSLLASEDVPSSPAPMNTNLPFMKDYSQLMKKADQISKSKSF